MISYLKHIFAAVKEIVSYLCDRYILKKPISYPGDPIANQQSRIGRWPKKEFRITPGWLFSHAKDSHTITEKNFNNKHSITGEPAGRQIWYKEPSSELKNTSLDEAKLVGGFDELTFCAAANPNSADKLLRKQLINEWKGPLPDENSIPKTALDSARKAVSYYQMLQCEDGHWAGDYGGPMFLMPGFICTLYLMNAPFPVGRKEGMIAYLLNHQQIDGGWGTHIECASTMFGTILSYVSLRLLGEDPESDHMVRGRAFIHSYGGALYAPSWAKFWLAAIGVYEWDGINSVPVEMWYLPRWFPFHPGKMWCHSRMVYLPMGYVYGMRYTPDVNSREELLGLRKELYCQPYESINWDNYRQTCADIDEYSPLNPVMKIAQDFLSYYEYWLPSLPFMKKLRKLGLDFVIKYIHEEDLQTNYIDIGPVNKAMNMLCVWINSGFDITNKDVIMHLMRVDDYLWVAEDGLKVQGYNGSQCWDTSFFSQGLIEGELHPEFPECVQKIYNYLEKTQIANDENDREYFFRHQSKGGWPFSTAAHGWPISDCTAEGLKSVLALHKSNSIPVNNRISSRRLYDACDVILSYQNKDGGWATYENTRGGGWYELLNPSEVFGDIMIDYSYVECSSACITALIAFRHSFPNYKTNETIKSIKSGVKFLKSIQRNDGSWYGSWGCCFTYGTWFGIEGLVASGEELLTSKSLQKSIQFLLSKQNNNGGWGENYLACVNKVYSVNGTGTLGEEESGVVQTAWAMLGLMAACHKDKSKHRDAIEKAKLFLMKRQLPNGDWEQEGITGVFNRSCGITYSQYRNIFPMWALARYAVYYENN
eukprot:gene8554-11560_t